MASKPKTIEAPAEVENEAQEGATPATKKFPLKLVIVAVAALVVLGGGAGAYFMFASGKSHEAVEALVKPPVFFDVPEVLVNLSNTPGDRTQYLKVKIVLELSDQTLTPQVQSAMPRVMDTFQTFLREMRPADLDGSAGLYRLKEELTRRINATIAPSRINAVLFKEMVVQ